MFRRCSAVASGKNRPKTNTVLRVLATVLPYDTGCIRMIFSDFRDPPLSFRTMTGPPRKTGQVLYDGEQVRESLAC